MYLGKYGNKTFGTAAETLKTIPREQSIYPPSKNCCFTTVYRSNVYPRLLILLFLLAQNIFVKQYYSVNIKTINITIYYNNTIERLYDILCIEK